MAEPTLAERVGRLEREAAWLEMLYGATTTSEKQRPTPSRGMGSDA